MTRLLIVQPYVPSYRVPFFDAVATELGRDGIDVCVASPTPTGELVARADDDAQHDWSVRTRGRQRRVFGPTLTYLGSHRLQGSADAVVVPFAASIIDTVDALLGRRRRPRRVAVWGHIDNFVTDANRLDALIESHLIRRADHVFAYTEAGARHARILGAAATRVTVLNNTIDTAELERAVATTTRADVEAFCHEHGLDPAGTTFGVLGALDESKRVDLLAAILDSLWELDPTAKVVVAGRGEREGLIRRAVERGQVAWIGRADARRKALLGHVCRALINPGRIGLVAVDGLVLRLPLLTASDFRHHAPEVAYLQEGTDLLTLPADPGAFATRALVVERPEHASRAPAMVDMVGAFTAGVRSLFG